MIIDPRLIADIKKAEGCPIDKASGLPVAYKDSLGYWTAGYGHLLDQSQDWTGKTFSWETFSWDQVNQWLADDLQKFVLEAQKTPEWQYLDTPCRCNAVIECIYNLGVEHWTQEFPGTRAAIRRQDWQSAHDNLMKSPLWIKEVGIGRVQRLANYLLWGAYPS